MKGQRINQSVAPTYFIIPISFFLMKTVSLIVFIIIPIEIIARIAIITTDTILNIASIAIRVSVNCCAWRIDSIP